jgi:hypothetical protein
VNCVTVRPCCFLSTIIELPDVLHRVLRSRGAARPYAAAGRQGRARHGLGTLCARVGWRKWWVSEPVHGTGSGRADRPTGGEKWVERPLVGSDPAEEGGSRPISRVLSRAIIHLGRTSPCASSDLPGSPCGPQERARRPARFPIWSCSRWGLPCRRVLPPARCALTAPFHPCRPQRLPRRLDRTCRPVPSRTAASWAVCSLLHFPWARAPQALPGTSPSGARTFLHVVRRSDCLADSRVKYR